jgi:hypothetical protein
MTADAVLRLWHGQTGGTVPTGQHMMLGLIDFSTAIGAGTK